MNLSVAGLASGKTVQVRIYNLTTTTEVVAWTATGVIERANGEGYSTYYYNYTITPNHDYIVDWKDNSSPVKTAAELIYGDLSAIKDALTVTTFAVVADGSNSVLQFKTDLSSVVNDFYKGIWVVPTTGVLAGTGPRKVSTYNGSTKIITLTSGYTSTPADGVIFEVISD